MRRATHLLALCVLTVGLAAPAAAAPSRHATSPDEWIQRATAAATSAKSVHVVATGIPNAGSTMSWNFRLVAGKGGAGFMKLGKDKVDLVRVGAFAYFRSGAAFWRKYGGKAAAQLFARRWVKMSASNPNFQAFTELTDIPKFFGGVLGSHGALKLGGTKTINGTKAIALIDTSNNGGTLWIASTGTPYPLELTPPSGPGLILFESWNRPMKVAAPRNAIDFSKLKK